MSAFNPLSLTMAGFPAVEDDLGRRRLQQKGDLRKMGGYWRGRWHEDQIQPDGSIKPGWSKFRDIGPCEGEKPLTKPEAKRAFWNNYLSRLDQNMRTPQSIMTMRQFVEVKFLPENVMMMKPAGRTHYNTILPHVLDGIPEKRRSFKGKKMEAGKWVEEENPAKRNHGIGKLRMRDVGHEESQRLVSEAIRRGYSVQTAKHIRNCISALFTYAYDIEWFNGRNPAAKVRLPEMIRREVRALSYEELNKLLALLKPMAKAMVLCASLTSLNIAEVCGLRWMRVNLTAAPVIVDGESIPPFHAAVREQWYLRQWGTVKAKARRRFVPLPKLLVEALTELRDTQGEAAAVVPGSACTPAGGMRTNSNDPVFAGESGRPVDQGAMLRRQVRKASAEIGVPGLGWHDLRRTFATLADQLGLTIGERQALMGHARAAQTLAYTHTPSEFAIAALERMGDKVKGAVN